MSELRLTAQQQNVVDNRGGTLLVSAAAGSGKTKVLVDRVMDRILREGKSIHEFLIITFTNAAASELRGKISKAIAKAMANDPANRHLQRQLNLVSLAQISTVHAFCGTLIRQYGYLLEIPSDYTMLEDPQREEMLTRILNDILEEEYEKKDPGFLLLTDTLGAGRNDNGLLDLTQNLFEKLLSQPYPEQWLRQQVTSIPEDTDLSQTVWGKILLDDARQQLTWLIDRYSWAISLMQGDEKLIPKYLPLYENHKKCLEHMLFALDGPWDQIGDALTMEYPRVSVQKYPDPERLDAIKAVKSDGKELLESLQKRFSRPQAVLLQEQNTIAPALQALFRIVLTLYRRFSQEKRRKNKLDFNDQEHLAIALLLDSQGRPTDVARAVQEQYAEIMVDEYQDSNRVQELIYTAISRNGDTNRFLVGDVKQSIYGFRQAQPELFIEKYGSYCPGLESKEGEPRYLVLSKNFRSRPEILEAVNHVFGSIMTPELGGLAYDENQMLHQGPDHFPQDGRTHVELDVLDYSQGKGSAETDTSKYQAEAQWVTNRIITLLQDNTPVRDGENTQPLQPEDIAILFRSRDPMGIYRRMLTRAGLPVQSDAGEDLFETPEVGVLLNLLRVLDNPHQDVPLLSVLCSPMFRMSNEDLAKIRISSSEERFYDALMEADLEFTIPIKKRLGELRKAARSMSGEALVWYLIYDGGLMTAYSAMEGGEARRDHLLQIYELARNCSGGNHLYLHELVQYLERQQESGLKSGSAGTTGITLTTIHKSKGLEYPVVFLCDLSRKFNFREQTDNLLVDGVYGIGAKITDREQRIRYAGLSYEAIKIVKQKQLLSEELRVLYVAMTRPKDYLFMVYTNGNKKPAYQALMPGTGHPCAPWAGAGAKCLGDWVLLAAMNRIEAGDLFSQVGRPQCELLVSDYPWNIRVEALEEPEALHYRSNQPEETNKKAYIPVSQRLVDALNYRYPYEKATKTPSKLTATELKGRSKDQEAAEETATTPKVPQLKRPDFILAQRGLTATEKGTAAHLFLQYADFSSLHTMDGVIGELDRLVDGDYITQQQADAVAPETMVRLFQSPLGQRLRQGEKLIREFKFSMLWDAETYYQDIGPETVLLQGVVDAAIVEADGLTIVDFKTDHVSPGGEPQRSEYYRGQLETYKKALSRIFKLPIKETLLYFLSTGAIVKL